MTRKQSLYACAVGVLFGILAAPSAAQERPPCAACLSVALPAAAWPVPTRTEAAVLVIRPGDKVDA